MQSFKHPNVMCLIGVCKNLSGGPAVVMPFMANGSILDYLRRERKNLVLDAKAEETMVCTLHAVKCNGVESASLPNVTTFMCYYSKLDEICCKVHWQQIFSTYPVITFFLCDMCNYTLSKHRGLQVTLYNDKYIIRHRFRS